MPKALFIGGMMDGAFITVDADRTFYKCADIPKIIRDNLREDGTSPYDDVAKINILTYRDTGVKVGTNKVRVFALEDMTPMQVADAMLKGYRRPKE